MSVAVARAWGGEAASAGALAAAAVGVGVAAMALRVRKTKTFTVKELVQQVRAEYAADPALRGEVLEAELARPKRREHCRDGIRPCPWASCQHHTAFEVTASGGLKVNHPGVELEDLPETCALDAAERGGMTLEEVGRVLNVTREFVRQVEERGLEAMRAEVQTTWRTWR